MNAHALTVLLAAGALASASPAAAAEHWAGAWGYASAPSAGAQDAVLPPGTYRYRVRLTQSGSAVRLTFANPEGEAPVAIARVAIAPALGAATQPNPSPGAEQVVTFSGAGTITLGGGRAMISDPVRLPIKAGTDLVVSVRFASPTRPARTNLGLPIAFAADDGNGFAAVKVRPYLTLVAVAAPASPCTIVAFGDSITDGFLAQSPTTRGWPGRLAERLRALPAARRCGVVNMGISGNRVLSDGRGPAALDRFWRDVAAVPGVTHVILLEGINDIGSGGSNGTPPMTAETLIAGYRQIVARAHSLGIRIIGATMTPAARAGYMSPTKDRVRKAANDWIRTGGAFDAVIDFDAAIRDPASPDDLGGAFDPGDHLHPNDAGYRAMGDAIDLGIFAPVKR